MIKEVMDVMEENDDPDSIDVLTDLEDFRNGEFAVSVVHVTRINLKNEYMKIQRKKVEGSQQRIEDGTVYFTVSSPMQILRVRTFVQRLTDWFEDYQLNRPENSWSELYTKMVRQKVSTYDYMTDLDSVYKTKEGGYVYSLFKNKGDSSKNTYVFFVVVELVDQTVQSFCWPFQLKTKPIKKPRTNGEEINRCLIH